MVIVKTEKELERALEAKAAHIIFEGPKAHEIAKKFEEAEAKRRRTKNTMIGIGILSILAIPFIAGTSLFGLSATVGAVALSDTVIMTIISGVVTISVAAIKAIKEYRIKKLEGNRIEFVRKTA